MIGLIEKYCIYYEIYISKMCVRLCNFIASVQEVPRPRNMNKHVCLLCVCPHVCVPGTALKLNGYTAKDLTVVYMAVVSLCANIPHEESNSFSH